jgi:hypothetical protein
MVLLVARMAWHGYFGSNAAGSPADDVDRFHAEADKLADEADDVLLVVVAVGVGGDAAARILRDKLPIDQSVLGAADPFNPEPQATAIRAATPSNPAPSAAG